MYNRNLYDGLINGSISYIYNIGFVLGVSIVIQIVTGIILSMYFIGSIDGAFDSVEYIMREVSFGYWMRHILANGVSILFIMIYLLIYKSIYYGSYIIPRTEVFITGVVLFLLLIIVSFLGYSLVSGIQSYWAIVVITNLLSSIPLIGYDLVILIWSSYSPSSLTIRRFYALLYFLGISTLAIIIALVIALLLFGGTTTIGISGNNSLVNFLPYLTIKDIYPAFCYLFIINFVIHFIPFQLEDVENNIPFNSLVTPLAIVPLWYLLPFYTILRSIDNKFGGVIFMILSILVLIYLPFNNCSLVRSNSFRTVLRIFTIMFFIIFYLLLVLGAKIASMPWIFLAKVFTYFYFSYLTFITICASIVDNFILYY